MSPNPKFLLWCDLETTGLDPQKDVILEIAIGVAKFGDPFTLLFPPTHKVLKHDGPAADVDPYVVKMHTENGLWDLCKSSENRLPLVEAHLSGYLTGVASEEERAIIAGASAHFDLRFIQYHMPRLASKLNSHKVYDTSAFKLLAASMGRNETNDEHLATLEKVPPAGVAHRALEDMTYCIKDGKRAAQWLTDKSKVQR